MGGRPEFLVILSEVDPVARAVSELWGVPPSTGSLVDGAPIRQVGDRIQTLKRPGRHIFDDDLDRRLPEEYRQGSVPLVFPSVHRSESGQPCLTAHPIGNPGPEAELGGRPYSLPPSAPGLMASALTGLVEAGSSIGLPATLEATHHGPAVQLPALFLEIACAEGEAPRDVEVHALESVLRRLEPDRGDRVAVGIGGGHYAPHFGELIRERRWAIGHILSRHALEALTPSVLEQAWAGTAGAEGFLLARAADWNERFAALGPRLRDGDAPRRAAQGAARSD